MGTNSKSKQRNKGVQTVSLTTIFIASPEGANGRNVVANGVTAALAQDNRKTAIFHPIT